MRVTVVTACQLCAFPLLRHCTACGRIHRDSISLMCGIAGMRLADGMSKAAVAFLAKQLAAENTHSGMPALMFCLLAFSIRIQVVQAV